jgi:putative spermidine/putrescine transport system permease protein
VVFYLMIGSLVAPGLVLGIGVGLICNVLGIETSWYTTALGAQLSWTLPFGVLVMFAVMSRLNNAWEEAARDLGASAWQTTFLVIVPILAPGLVAVALFGFTLSYDEFTRALLTAGSLNTLPLEIWSMTLNVTSPVAIRARHGNDLISFAIIGSLPRHHRANPESGARSGRRRTREPTELWLSRTEASNWRVSSKAMTAQPGSLTAST